MISALEIISSIMNCEYSHRFDSFKRGSNIPAQENGLLRQLSLGAIF